MLLSQKLMLETPNARHGSVLEPQRAPLSQSDVRSIVHMGVPASVSTPWQSAAGGVARDSRLAELAAIGEAIERAVAVLADIPQWRAGELDAGAIIPAEDFCFFDAAQRAREDFPFNVAYSDACHYAEVFDIHTHAPHYVPHSAVALADDQHTGFATSSGLAAGATQQQALLRGIQELIERDALMTTWLHGLPGRRVASLPEHEEEVAAYSGQLYTFDMTPAYSPFPVVAVMGGIPKEGRWRYSLGVACRESWHAAAEKAYLEWNQGVLFAGVYGEYVDTSGILDPYTLESFDQHAIFYTLHPDQWDQLAIFAQKDTVHATQQYVTYTQTDEALRVVRAALKTHNIRLYYRDITTVDAMQVGLSVVKAVSPDMAQIFAHQSWPFLNKGAAMLARNFPESQQASKFPYMMPHPLG